MEIIIDISQEEKVETLKAIRKLNEVPHLKNMSQALIAETANIKPTKVRLILAHLIDIELVIQYRTSQNKHIQRYYYVVTQAGMDFIQN